MDAVQRLWNWVINLPLVFVDFIEWLTTDLPYINVSPLGLISFAGLTALISILLVRLFVGG